IESDDVLTEGFKHNPSDPITVSGTCDVYQYIKSFTGKKVDTAFIETNLQSLFEKFPNDPVVIFHYAKYHLQNATLSSDKIQELLRNALSQHDNSIGLA